MKVLIYRYGSICEPDLIESFREIGLDVIEFKREMTDKEYELRRCVRELSDFLDENPVDFIFSVNFFPAVSSVCNVYHLRYLCWIVDAPVMELYTKAIENEYNRVFIFDRAVYDEIHPYNPYGVFHLPLAANTLSKEKLFSETSDNTRTRFRHDISFVGSLYTEKSLYDRVQGLPDGLRGYLDGLMRAQEKIYGYYFVEELLSDEHVKKYRSCYEDFYTIPGLEHHLTDKRTLSQYYMGNKITAMERTDTFKMLSERYPVYIYTASDTSMMPQIHNMGRAKTLTEMPVIFREAGININTTSKAIRTGLPLRIFDILSCEGFLISNYQEEIPELFTPGEDLVMYSSLEELSDLCAYFLEHKDRAREIAHSGYEKLKANYTYEKQLEKLFMEAFKH